MIKKILDKIKRAYQKARAIYNLFFLYLVFQQIDYAFFLTERIHLFVKDVVTVCLTIIQLLATHT